MSDNCCICLESDKITRKLSELDQNNQSFYQKLEKIVKEIRWSEDLLICTECIEILNIVEEFIDKCHESNKFRTYKPESSSGHIKSLDDCINELLSDTDDPQLDQTYEPPQSESGESESEEESTPKATNKKLFQCEVCNDTFKNIKKYLAHCNNVHKILARNKKPYFCKICKGRFAIHANYSKHMKYHRDNNETEPQSDGESCKICKICERTFTKSANLKRHILNKHPGESSGGRPQFCCSNCNQNFTSKWNLSRHIRRCLPNSIRKKKIMKCVLCNYYQDTRENVVAHYSNYHQIEVITKKLTFANYSDFEMWKEQTEKDTVSRYVKASFHKSSGKSTHYYRCHRDGFYKNAGKNIRRLKQSGSNKIDGVCPAKMQASFTEENGEVVVEYIETHVGHTMDLKRIPLKKSERNFLASQISQKVSFDDLISSVRNNIGASNFERITLLTKKDLFNIEQLYNLNKDPERQSNDPNRRHNCPQCGKEYKILKMMRSHMAKVHHAGSSNVQANVEVPVKEKKFFCHVCPKSYYAQNQLTRHLYTHSGEKPFLCLVCDKRFTDKAYAKQHMKNAHNVAFDIKYEPLTVKYE